MHLWSQYTTFKTEHMPGNPQKTKVWHCLGQNSLAGLVGGGRRFSESTGFTGCGPGCVWRWQVRVLRARQGTLRDVSRWKLAALGTPSPEETLVFCGGDLYDFTCKFMASNIITPWWFLGFCAGWSWWKVEATGPKNSGWISCRQDASPKLTSKHLKNGKITSWKRRFLLKTIIFRNFCC